PRSDNPLRLSWWQDTVKARNKQTDKRQPQGIVATREPSNDMYRLNSQNTQLPFSHASTDTNATDKGTRQGNRATTSDINPGRNARHEWIAAFKHIFPIYLATHLAFAMLTYLASLFSIKNFTSTALSPRTLLTAWDRWDSGQFVAIAMHGYSHRYHAAFFPLYPYLERFLGFVTGGPFIAGLIISNIAGLVLFMVLYRLVKDDFDENLAGRTVLYLAVFPTSFFLAAAYNESLFLCLTLLSFYSLRGGRWWLTGIFGLLAALTRSSGLFLLIPFCYEYLRQHQFRWKAIGFSVLSGLLIPLGVGIFAVYCFLHYHDALAFSHAQATWGRQLQPPWMTFVDALLVIKHYKFLSFNSIHTVLDFAACVLMLVLTILCFVGPWKFGKEKRAYALYAAAFYLFLILFPAENFPVQSISRQVIEIFPAFIVLALLGRRPNFNLYYLTIVGALLGFMLLQYLSGYWIV
ncbi:MAG: glycosyltransferase family 39 protein, partial [Ktedonobacteraceae bacterium]|nr:glycosyltransferase family 39 protein [Ktedonobacteraceae bacterium]